eukprot:357881-Chlamydomonas_euryale.AAC.10
MQNCVDGNPANRLVAREVQLLEPVAAMLKLAMGAEQPSERGGSGGAAGGGGTANGGPSKGAASGPQPGDRAGGNVSVLDDEEQVWLLWAVWTVWTACKGFGLPCQGRQGCMPWQRRECGLGVHTR